MFGFKKKLDSWKERKRLDVLSLQLAQLEERKAILQCELEKLEQDIEKKRDLKEGLMRKMIWRTSAK